MIVHVCCPCSIKEEFNGTFWYFMCLIDIYTSMYGGVVVYCIRGHGIEGSELIGDTVLCP